MRYWYRNSPPIYPKLYFKWRTLRKSFSTSIMATCCLNSGILKPLQYFRNASYEVVLRRLRLSCPAKKNCIGRDDISVVAGSAEFPPAFFFQVKQILKFETQRERIVILEVPRKVMSCWKNWEEWVRSATKQRRRAFC